MLVALVACSENTLYISDGHGSVDYSESDASETIKGNIKIDGRNFDGVDKIETFSSAGTVSGSNFEIKTLNTGKPMLLLCSNANEEITFMYRGRMSSTSSIEVNERTTAIALLSLHPAFWSLNLNDFDSFSKQISQLNGFDNLVKEVKTQLGSNRNLMDTSNKSLVEAMNNCYCELLGIDASKAEKLKAQATSKADKASNGEDEEDTHPIEFSPEAQTLAARVSGLAPVYECYTEHDMVRSKSQFLLPHETYSWTDLYQMVVSAVAGKESIAEGWDNLCHGDWETFNLSDAGDYYFTADAETDDARIVQIYYVLNDVFNMFGGLTSINKRGVDSETGKKVWLETSILNPAGIKEFDEVLTYAFNATKAALNPDYIVDPGGKWAETLYNLALSNLWTWLENHESSILNKGALAKVMKGLSIVDGISAIAGNMGRHYMRAKCPSTIQKCFSQHNSVITNCMGVGVYVKSGIKQIGDPGKQLSMPIRFGVKCQVGQGIRLEVVDGGGTLDRYHKTIYQPDGEEEIVDINWTLGQQEGEQTIRAWVEDVVTHKKQGLYCYVTASASTGSLLTSIGDAFLFTYDDKGRIETITDRTCMLVEPDPTEITKSTYIYKDDNSRELKMIITHGDGETDKWYNIKYNSDGTMKSFRWSGTDEDGTEYGSGQFSYDNDGHIKTIVSHAEDGNVYLNFKWENGNLTEFIYSDPNAEYEEDKTDNVFISYGMQKNVHKQYPLAMVALELGTIFFSGQIGHGPDYLPIQVGSIEQAVNTEYTLREDGYIKNERVSDVGNPLVAFNFAYNYTQNQGERTATRQTAPRRQQQTVGARKFKHFRMLGLRRR